LTPRLLLALAFDFCTHACMKTCHARPQLQAVSPNYGGTPIAL
jgi:hypothetical protein